MQFGRRELLDENEADEPAWFSDASAEDHEAVTVYFHPQVPEATLVVLRPWAR